MFRECINNPIDPIPYEYVNTLQRLSSEPDYSMTCLGIALFKPRIKDYGGITGTYASGEREKACVDHFIDVYYPKLDTYPMLCYYRYTTPHDYPEEIKKQLNDK